MRNYLTGMERRVDEHALSVKIHIHSNARVLSFVAASAKPRIAVALELIMCSPKRPQVSEYGIVRSASMRYAIQYN